MFCNCLIFLTIYDEIKSLICITHLDLTFLYYNKALTDAQLDDLAVFYGVGPATGVKLVKQRLLRPILGDYRSDQ